MTSSPEFVGVGISIKIMENGKCTVINTIPGGSAHESGKITPGDLLLGVYDKERGEEFVSTNGLEFNEIKSLIVGPRGSKISLKLQHSQGSVQIGEYICEDLVREQLPLSAAERGSSPGISLEVY